MADSKQAANQLAILQKDIADAVTEKINTMTQEGDLALPVGYNVGNALKSAMFIIQGTKDRNNRNALDVCKTTSVANALLNMCVQGLSPERNQCYFIVYGDELQLVRSYFGAVAALMRANPRVHKVVCELAHEGDELRWGWTKEGERYVVYIETDPLTNRAKPFLGGFCNIFDVDGELMGYTFMSWKEIQTSWEQSKTYGRDNSTHKKFPEEMAKRTLIARACKFLLNTSTSDGSNSCVVDAFNRTTEAQYGNSNQASIARKTEVKPLTKAEAIKAEYFVEKEPEKQEAEQQGPNIEDDDFCDFPENPGEEGFNLEGF